MRKAVGAAPTVLLVRDGEGHVFGAYAPEPWRHATRFYGTGETFVFQVRKARSSLMLPTFGGSTAPACEAGAAVWSPFIDCCRYFKAYPLLLRPLALHFFHWCDCCCCAEHFTQDFPVIVCSATGVCLLGCMRVLCFLY
jgi:hypothetical protein